MALSAYTYSHIQQEFGPISGLCTFKLLDELRFGICEPVKWNTETFACDIDSWFSGLRGTTSEWDYRPKNQDKAVCDSLAREGMLWHQWKCMGEQLLALDRAIHVPRDCPEIQKINRCTRSIPEYIADKINTNMKEHLHKEFLGVDIIPIGSFNSNAKVIDMDEVDYLLVVNTFYPFSKICLRIFHNAVENLARIAEQNRKQKLCLQPAIREVFAHGPAMCFTVNWLCTERHVHEISVDVSLSIKTVLEPYTTLKDSVKLMKEHKLFRNLYKTIGHSEPAIEIQAKFTTATLDQQLCATLESVSPNVLAAYRLLKFLVQMVLPNKIVENQSLSCDDDDDNHMFMFREGDDNAGKVADLFPPAKHPLIDSHSLKHTLYRYVEKYHQTEDWGAEMFHNRVLDLLSLIDVENKQKDCLLKPDDYRRNPTYGFLEVKNIWKIYDMKRLGSQKNNIKVLIELIKERVQYYKECNGQQPFGRRLEAGAALVFENEHFHLVNIKQLNSLAIFPGDVYLFQTFKSHNLFTTHPLVHLWESTLFRMWTDNHGSDLPKIDASYLIHVWFFYTAGFVSTSNLADEALCESLVMKTKTLMNTIFRKVEHRFHMDYLGVSPAIAMAELISLAGALYPDKFSSSNMDFVLQALPKLSTKERAMLAAICSAPFKDLDSGKIDSITERSMFEESNIFQGFSPVIERIINAVDDFYVDLRMIYLKRYGAPSRTSILPSFIFYYMLKHDENYMTSFKDETFQACSESLHGMVEKRLNNLAQRHWKKAKVQHDSLSLFRGITVLLDFGSFGGEQIEKSGSGKLFNLSAESVQFMLCKGMKQEVTNLYRMEKRNIKGVLTHSKDLYKASLKDRIKLLAVAGACTSYLELLAVAYLSKRQVQIYRDAGDDFQVEDILPIHGMYSGRPEFNILLTDKKGGQYFDPLILNSDHLVEMIPGRSSQRVPQDVFESLAESAPVSDTKITFSEVLTAAGFLEIQETNI